MKVFVILVCIIGYRMTMADEEDDLQSCTPQLADRCFTEIYDKLPCQLKELDVDLCDSNPTTIEIALPEFCRALDDGLRCTSDIIDIDCTVIEGRYVFDMWLKGLTAVAQRLCKDDLNETLKVLTDNAKCWNNVIFMECIKRTTLITHVVDLMHSSLTNVNNFISVLIRTVECNLIAGTKPDESCSPVPPKELIEELINIFFSQTSCISNTDKMVFSSSSVINSNIYQTVFVSCLSIFYTIIISCNKFNVNF